MSIEENDTTFISFEVWDESGTYALSVNLDANGCYYMPHFEIYKTPFPLIQQNSSTIVEYTEFFIDTEMPEIWDNDKFLFQTLFPTCELYTKYGWQLPDEIFSKEEIAEYNKNLYDITETIPRENLGRVQNIFVRFFKTCEQFNLKLSEPSTILNDSDSTDAR